MSERAGTVGRMRTRLAEQDVAGLFEPAGFADWPGTVRVVASQPSLWWSPSEPEPEPAPAAAAVAPSPGVVRLGPDALVVGGELALTREIGQSFALMGLMALLLSAFVGLGMLAVRVLV